MSFTRRGRGEDRSFELVRMSLLQGDDLPFQDALTVEQMRLAFEAEGVSFGEDDEPTNIGSTNDGSTNDGSVNIGSTNDEPPSEDDSRVVFTRGMTLWAMLSQALFTDVQRSCLAAVQRVAVCWAILGREVSSTNTGAYTRAKVTEGVVRRLTEGVAERCEAAVPDDWKWHGFRTLVIDGTTFSMPDTEASQAEYPQPNSQVEGLGFPILRAVALTSLATGMVVALTTGPYASQESGETALSRTLFEKLQRGDDLGAVHFILPIVVVDIHVTRSVSEGDLKSIYSWMSALADAAGYFQNSRK